MRMYWILLKDLNRSDGRSLPHSAYPSWGIGSSFRKTTPAGFGHVL